MESKQSYLLRFVPKWKNHGISIQKSTIINRKRKQQTLKPINLCVRITREGLKITIVDYYKDDSRMQHCFLVDIPMLDRER